jgi:hypothetical protein
VSDENVSRESDRPNCYDRHYQNAPWIPGVIFHKNQSKVLAQEEERPEHINKAVVFLVKCQEVDEGREEQRREVGPEPEVVLAAGAFL